MSGFNFDKAEVLGNIEDVFFKDVEKGNTNKNQQVESTDTTVEDIDEKIKNKSKEYEKSQTNLNNSTGRTVIKIDKEVIGAENDMDVVLSEQEEKRYNTTSVKNTEYIDVNTGEVVTIIEKTEMYNGAHLYTVKHESEKMITYPRSKFVGKEKQFVPKIFYIREAERAIEDSIDNRYVKIKNILENEQTLNETGDKKYLEIVLDEFIEISGGMKVPDKTQIPIIRMFDLEYKIMMLEKVICLDNKIASLVFRDIWF